MKNANSLKVAALVAGLLALNSAYAWQTPGTPSGTNITHQAINATQFGPHLNWDPNLAHLEQDFSQLGGHHNVGDQHIGLTQGGTGSNTALTGQFGDQTGSGVNFGRQITHIVQFGAPNNTITGVQDLHQTGAFNITHQVFGATQFGTGGTNDITVLQNSVQTAP